MIAKQMSLPIDQHLGVENRVCTKKKKSLPRKSVTVEMETLEENPQSGKVNAVEELAISVAEFSDGVKQLLNGKMTKKGIVILLQGITKQSRTEIEKTLKGIEDLKRVYCR